MRTRIGALAAAVLSGALLLAPVAASAGAATRSAQPIADGPNEPEYAVGRREVTFVDSSRPTDANRSFTGAPDRTLPVLIMYPATGTPGGLSEPDARPARRAGPFPLVVFSHGFRATGPAYGDVLLRRIAAHGYVVAAPTFPLSNARAPGGPKLKDYVNQPADVSFVIDRVLAMNRRKGPLRGLIERKEIGAMGHSLGGITTLGVTYNRANVDARIKAAVPISGLQLPFPDGTWTFPDVPLLLIHGDDDRTIPYAGSTLAYAAAKAPKFLLTLLDAPHTPFGAPFLDQVVRSIDDFLDRYLRHEKRALARLVRGGTVAGVSTLESDPR
jgi:dienelactone hydrolase